MKVIDLIAQLSCLDFDAEVQIETDTKIIPARTVIEKKIKDELRKENKIVVIK